MDVLIEPGNIYRVFSYCSAAESTNHGVVTSHGAKQQQQKKLSKKKKATTDQRQQKGPNYVSWQLDMHYRRKTTPLPLSPPKSNRDKHKHGHCKMDGRRERGGMVGWASRGRD